MEISPRSKNPINEGKPYEFISNFDNVLKEHGLTHQYIAEGAGFSFELSDNLSFTRHDVFGPRRVFGKKIPLVRRKVASILSESTRDLRLPFSRLAYQGLVLQVSSPEDKKEMDKVVKSLHEIYPDEPATILIK